MHTAHYLKQQQKVLYLSFLIINERKDMSTEHLYIYYSSAHLNRIQCRQCETKLLPYTSKVLMCVL